MPWQYDIQQLRVDRNPLVNFLDRANLPKFDLVALFESYWSWLDLADLRAAFVDLAVNLAGVDWTAPEGVRSGLAVIKHFGSDLKNWAGTVVLNLLSLGPDGGSPFGALASFLPNLRDVFEINSLKTLINDLIAAWAGIDFSNPNHLQVAWSAIVAFVNAFAGWFRGVVSKTLGIIAPGWFAASDIKAVWSTFTAAWAAIDFSAPHALRLALTAVLGLTSGVRMWLIAVFKNLSGFDLGGLNVAASLSALRVAIGGLLATVGGIDWTSPGAVSAFIAAAVAGLQGSGNWALAVLHSFTSSDTTVIHGMFASVHAFINAVIEFVFGDSTPWQDALDFLSGITNAAPWQAITAVYNQLTDFLSTFSLSGLADIKVFFGGLINGLFDAFNGTSGSTGKTLSDLFTAAEALYGATGGAAIQTLLNGLFDAFNGTSGSTGKSIGDVTTVVAAFIAAAGGAIVTDFQTLLNNLVDAFNGTTGSIGQTVADVFAAGQALYTALGGKALQADLQTLLNNLYDAFNGSSGSTGKTLANVLSSARSYISGISTALSGKALQADLQTLLNNLFDAFNGSSGSSGKTLANLLAAAQSYITAIASSLGGKALQADLQTLLNNLFDAFNGTTGSIGKTLAHVLAAAQAYISDISTALGGKALQSDLQTLLNDLFDAFNGTTGSIGKTLANVLTAAQALLTTINGKALQADLQTLLNNLFDAFGGTTGSTGKTLANVFAAGQALLTTINGKALQADLQTLLNNLFDAFLGSTGSTGKTLANVLSAGQSVINAIYDAFNNSTGSTGKKLADVITAGHAVWTSLSAKALQADLQTLLNNLYDAFNGTTGSTGITLANVLTKAQALLTTVNAKALQADLQTLFNNLFDAFNGSSGSTGKTLANVLTAGQALYTTLGGKALQADLQTLLNNLYDAFNGTTGSTGITLANVLTKAQALLTTINAKALQADLQTLFNNLFDAFNGSSGSTGKTLANVLTAGQALYTALSGKALQADLQTLLNNLFDAFNGSSGSTGKTLANVLAAGQALLTALNGKALGSDLQAVSDGIQQAVLNDGASHAIANLKNTMLGALRGLLPAVVDNQDGTAAPLFGVTDNGDGTGSFKPNVNSLYALVDNVDGTATTVAKTLQNMAGSANELGSGIHAAISTAVGDSKGLVDGLQELVGGDGSSTGFVGDVKTVLRGGLQGLLPAVLDNADGTAAPVAGVTDNGDGTAAYSAPLNSNPIHTLIDNVDGTVTTVAKTLQNMASSAKSAGNSLMAAGTTQSILDGLVNGANNTSQSGHAPEDVQPALAAHTSTLAFHASSIGQIQATLAGGSSGLNVVVPFSGSLPSSFTNMGLIFGAATAFTGARYNAATALTDVQSVSGVWNANPNNDFFGYLLILRGNSSFTTLVCLEIILQGGVPQWALVAIVGGTGTEIDNGALPGPIPNNVITLSCDNGYDYTIEYNGARVKTVSDSSHISQLGPTYVNLGYATYEPALPGAITQWGCTSPAPAVGSIFRQYRTSTTPTAAIGTGAQLLPNTFFDSNQYATADLTSTPATANELQVSVDATYTVTVVLLGGTVTHSAAPCVFRNGSLEQVGNGMPSSAIQAGVPFGFTFSVYCNAGDILQPGVWSAAAGNTYVGEATGTLCYWTVALANCGILS